MSDLHHTNAFAGASLVVLTCNVIIFGLLCEQGVGIASRKRSLRIYVCCDMIFTGISSLFAFVDRV